MHKKINLMHICHAIRHEHITEKAIHMKCSRHKFSKQHFFLL